MLQLRGKLSILLNLFPQFVNLYLKSAGQDIFSVGRTFIVIPNSPRCNVPLSFKDLEDKRKPSGSAHTHTLMLHPRVSQQCRANQVELRRSEGTEQ